MDDFQKRVESKLDRIERDLVEIKIAIALLKFKSSLWGATAGGLVLLLNFLLNYLKAH